MKLPDSCRELFLDGVTDAYFYAVRESSVPIPFSIPMILQITGCHFAGEALHVALSEGDNYIISDSITAKHPSQQVFEAGWLRRLNAINYGSLIANGGKKISF